MFQGLWTTYLKRNIILHLYFVCLGRDVMENLKKVIELIEKKVTSKIKTNL